MRDDQIRMCLKDVHLANDEISDAMSGVVPNLLADLLSLLEEANGFPISNRAFDIERRAYDLS